MLNLNKIRRKYKMNNEKLNKLKMRDIITLSIFNIAMIAVMLVTKMCTMMLTTPAFDYLFYVGIMGITLWSYFCDNVQ